MIDYSNSHFDAKRGHELLRAAPAHARPRRRARLRRDHDQRAPQHGLQHEPVRQPARRAADRRDQEREDHGRGHPINLMYPNRVAEEYAMLDVMSGGRMEYAFPLGTGMEYWANETTINPATARARFRESLDIILKSWAEDGPMRYDGQFYNYRYLNPWPKPYQQPRPKCFIVGTGSEETVSLAIELRPGLLDRVRSDSEPAARLRAHARARRGARAHGRARRPDHRRLRLRRRHRRAGRERGAAAHRAVLQLVPPRHAALPRPSRLRDDEGVPAARVRRRDGEEHGGELGGHGHRSAASPAARRTRSPTRSSPGARRPARAG